MDFLKLNYYLTPAYISFISVLKEQWNNENSGSVYADIYEEPSKGRSSYIPQNFFLSSGQLEHQWSLGSGSSDEEITISIPVSFGKNIYSGTLKYSCYIKYSFLRSDHLEHQGILGSGSSDEEITISIPVSFGQLKHQWNLGSGSADEESTISIHVRFGKDVYNGT
ncbi:hypothetical protein CEXT_350821 [Caerostris extrusa]|uniref:Uncharacterized protein n=1 Tax=Caerostris extrusa TaxID=172846 RepID=A0AAV4W0Q0_CAEEX|nr:hypothetical protein CEXT_350821 [Caerostris extrusa]